jgi:hypothetical protein
MQLWMQQRETYADWGDKQIMIAEKERMPITFQVIMEDITRKETVNYFWSSKDERHTLYYFWISKDERNKQEVVKDEHNIEINLSITFFEVVKDNVCYLWNGKDEQEINLSITFEWVKDNVCYLSTGKDEQEINLSTTFELVKDNVCYLWTGKDEHDKKWNCLLLLK